MESNVIALQSKTERPIWLDADRLKLKGQKREHLRGLIEFLESRKGETQDLAECLFGKRLSAEEPATSMRTLVAQIASETPREFRNDVLLILGRVVDQRNRSQAFQLPLPGIPVTMPKPVPPFTPARWGGLASYRDWSMEVLADFVGTVCKVNSNGEAPSSVRTARIQSPEELGASRPVQPRQDFKLSGRSAVAARSSSRCCQEIRNAGGTT